MHPKHAWDKFIKLTGNVEEDIKNVIAFLEKSDITDRAYLIGKPRLLPEINPKIIQAIHEKKIGLYTVHVEFSTNIETGISSINNGWVITK